MIRVILLGILLLIIAKFFWRVIDVVIETLRVESGSSGSSKPAVKLVRDPVCGTYVAPGSALSLSAGGTTYYFCSDECRKKYRA